MYYSQRHIRRLIAQNTAINVDTISEPPPGCFYHLCSVDENNPELASQNQNDTIPKLNTNSDDSEDDNNIESDIVNSIDFTGEIDNLGLPCEVEDLQKMKRSNQKKNLQIKLTVQI